MSAAPEFSAVQPDYQNRGPPCQAKGQHSTNEMVRGSNLADVLVRILVMGVPTDDRMPWKSFKGGGTVPELRGALTEARRWPAAGQRREGVG
jgi:hypothetical protein